MAQTSGRMAHTTGPERSPSSGGDCSFTEAIDRRTGCIRASGRLDERAADMVSGTIETLRDRGWVRIVLDLGGVLDADEAGLRALHSLERRIAADGGHVALLNCPDARSD
ncbi:STAS domain-containing protein [Geodermatophilus sp. SYSU D01186]